MSTKIDAAVLEWIDKEGLRNSRGDLFEFDLHSFLLQPMADWSRFIAIRKSAQVGYTETFGVLKSLFAAIYFEHNVIYTNPTAQASDTFVATKVNTILDRNPKLLDHILVSKLDLKHVRTISGVDRFIYFRGTHSGETKDKQADATAGISITSDLNVYDERDRSDQFVIDQYSSRLENSKYGGEWSFSNPTYPGVGVDGLWEKSDQKHWMVKCKRCRHTQFLDWIKAEEVEGTTLHALVDSKKMCFVCGKCRKPLSDTDRMRGEWVAKHPEREVSGYWMSQMNYPKHTVESLLEKERSRKPDNFYNFVLGKPYQSEDVAITRNVIYQNVVRGDTGSGVCWMGVDQGVKKHWVIENETGIIAVGMTKSWDEIEALIWKYRPRCVVLDAMPYPNAVVQLREKFKDARDISIYMAYYKELKDQSEPVDWKRNKRKGEIIINRTVLFDIVVDKFMQQHKPINMNDLDLQEFAEAWSTMYRGTREDSLGILRPTWETSNKDIDHYCHATVYAEVASMKARKQVSELGQFTRKKENIVQGVETDDLLNSPLPSLSTIIEQSLGTKKRRTWPYT